MEPVQPSENEQKLSEEIESLKDKIEDKISEFEDENAAIKRKRFWDMVMFFTSVGIFIVLWNLAKGFAE